MSAAFSSATSPAQFRDIVAQIGDIIGDCAQHLLPILYGQ
jgi:hypothetical protein